MGNEFKDFEMETPSLTLEPDLESLKRKKKCSPKADNRRKKCLY